MVADTYRSIDRPAQGLYRDKGSRFIALAWPVDTEDQIGSILESVKKQYYDARHHCYAWALGPNRESFRFNDDGEPSGTAGKPIFGQILSFGLTNVLVIVVRYYGGIKLGVRGLIDAYRGATADAFLNAKLVTKVINEKYRIDFDYFSMNDVMKIIKDFELEQSNHQFDFKCTLTFSVRAALAPQVMAALEKIPQIDIKKL